MKASCCITALLLWLAPGALTEEPSPAPLNDDREIVRGYPRERECLAAIREVEHANQMAYIRLQEKLDDIDQLRNDGAITIAQQIAQKYSAERDYRRDKHDREQALLDRLSDLITR